MTLRARFLNVAQAGIISSALAVGAALGFRANEPAEAGLLSLLAVGILVVAGSRSEPLFHNVPGVR
jgi:hypothetical protein